MYWLLIITFLTIGVSSICSLLEAVILSTTVAEMEFLKKTYPRRGLLLERLKLDLEATSAAILSLNTIANTLGAVITSGLAIEIWGAHILGYFSVALTFGILFFGEILPKNAGVLYRSELQKHLVYPLYILVKIMTPLTFVSSKGITLLLRKQVQKQVGLEDEILLLAEKSAQEGELTLHERNMIVNAIELDQIRIHSIMTPRSVLVTLDENLTIGATYVMQKSLSFARIPVYKDSVEHITGCVRRRDILDAKAQDQDALLLKQLKLPILFIPDNASAADALKLFLKEHEQIGIVVDEFGSVVGVITLEDIIEQVLGQEIFEKDDIAVDMRAFARSKTQTATNIESM